jgi:hypothetical protein
MGFSVGGAGPDVVKFLPGSGGEVYIAFDIGVPLLYRSWTTGTGTGLYESSGTGFDISNDLANGTDDTILPGLDGQTIALKIESSAFVGSDSPVKVTFTIYGSGTPAYTASRVVNASGAFLSQLDIMTTLTACDLTDLNNEQTYIDIMDVNPWSAWGPAKWNWWPYSVLSIAALESRRTWLAGVSQSWAPGQTSWGFFPDQQAGVTIAFDIGVGLFNEVNTTGTGTGWHSSSEGGGFSIRMNWRMAMTILCFLVRAARSSHSK